jgi:hypothetical protein
MSGASAHLWPIRLPDTERAEDGVFGACPAAYLTEMTEDEVNAIGPTD